MFMPRRIISKTIIKHQHLNPLPTPQDQDIAVILIMCKEADAQGIEDTLKVGYKLSKRVI